MTWLRRWWLRRRIEMLRARHAGLCSVTYTADNADAIKEMTKETYRALSRTRVELLLLESGK